MNFREDVFYSIDQWLLNERSELLNDSETYHLTMNLKHAREALTNKLKAILNDSNNSDNNNNNIG